MWQRTMDDPVDGMYATDLNKAMEAANDALKEQGYDSTTFLVSLSDDGQIQIERGEF